MLNFSPQQVQELWPFFTDEEKREVLTCSDIVNAEKKQWKPTLLEFIKEGWHVLEPTTPFVNNWHIESICEHLEACSRGEITKLIINVPPGHMKSLLSCVFWPCWEWIYKPHLRWLFASYGIDLSVRDSIKTRILLTSEWYQGHFGKIYQLNKINEKLITNNKTGFRYATSTTGVGTGHRAHRVVNDDLLNATDANSEAMRQQAITHMEAMATRGVPSEPFIQVLIMQRLNELDPTQWAIDQGDWEKLILPAEFEVKRRAVTKIGCDPRQEEGELLWPELFGKEKIEQLKKALREYGAAAQLQQRPAPAEGGIIKLNLLKYYAQLPPIRAYLQSWDTAFKTKESNDFSVCTTWGLSFDGGIYLVDRFKARVEFPELKKQMVALARAYNVYVILVEDKASGQSLIQEMSRPVEDPINPGAKIRLPVKAIKVDTDKISRVHTCTPTLETIVFLPQNAPWLEDYIHNLGVFPNGAHDDDVDSTSQAINHIVLNRATQPQVVNFPYMQR